DHLDCYADLADIRAAFRAFLSGVTTDGVTIVCADDPGAREVAPPKAITYGEAPDAAWRIESIRPNQVGGNDVAVREPSGRTVRLRLAVPGRHNALNATAALSVCGVLGADLDAATDA